MQNLFIQSREGKKIAVLVEGLEKRGSLAFVMHGLSGNKLQPHISAFAEAFLRNGFTVVRFDTRNTYGESEGTPEDETITSDLSDLEDVIEWARKEPWFREPFFLAGHSLGGICTGIYAEKHPERVAGLAPISTVVNWELSTQTKKYSAPELALWKAAGVREAPSETSPGMIKRLAWGHVEDRMRYSLLLQAPKLTMPVLLIVGDRDEGTPPEHQKVLFDALPGPKEMHIIKGAPHTFMKAEHLEEIRQIFDTWIKKYV